MKLVTREALGTIAILLAIALAGCGSAPKRPTGSVARAPDGTPVKPGAPRAGGYYRDDGPGDNPPSNLDQIPDAVPKREPLHRGTMRPYTVMGLSYTPMTRLAPYKARGIATWYGRRYHGQRTASGEIYDMYQMTAAHTTLPIPSYARVTSLANNKSVVVRINDRGPFHTDRLIDLSYTAAYKLGVLGGGRAMVEVEAIIPDDSMPAATAPRAPVAGASSAAPRVAVTTAHKGMFLQLAAFSSQDNADNYLERLRAEIDWLAPALHVYSRDGLYRVHAGPYASEAEARSVAERISETLGIRSMVLLSR